MTSINELMPSKYLKKEDVTPDVLVTISNVVTENIAQDNETPKMKAIIYFHEFTQGLALNQINKESLIITLGTDQFEQWYGKQITLWNDRTVSMNGKLVGGVRIRIPQHAQTIQQGQPVQQGHYGQQDQQAQQEVAVNPSTAQAYDAQGKPLY